MGERRYWFPAKRHGWGWGVPVTWQGWVVLITYLVLVVAGAPIIHPRVNVVGYVLYVTVWTVVLVAICWRTGEPTRWRWGKE